MFEHVINSLLSGNVICRYTDRDGFEHLSREDNLRDANSYLFRIGRKVSTPDAGGAFFLVNQEPKSVRRAALDRLHKKLLGEVRPVLEFLELCLGATNTDILLRAGDQINTAEIFAGIDNDTKLRADLRDIVRQLPRAGGSNDQEMFDSILTRLTNWGYLVLENPERKIYRVTGLLDVFQDQVAFLIENTVGAGEAISDQLYQGDLL